MKNLNYQIQFYLPRFLLIDVSVFKFLSNLVVLVSFGLTGFGLSTTSIWPSSLKCEVKNI